MQTIPEGYHTITPYLIFDDAAQAIEFYERALGAKEVYRMPTPGGKIGHAELEVGDSRVMLADEAPEYDARSPRSVGGTPIMLHLYTENVDELAERFVRAGGKVKQPLKDQFYGDRSGQFEDPFGYRWALSQHVEDVPPEELQRRLQSMTE